MKILRIAFIAAAFTALVLGTACRSESNGEAEEPAAEAAGEEAPAEEAPAEEAPAEEAPAAAAAGADSFSLAPDFLPDPHNVQGTAGGPVEADGAETQYGDCIGFFPSDPQHTMELTEAFSYLKVSATSEVDTSLKIEGPGGMRCNDDDEDLDPAISGEWPAGTYRIFVGSYDAEETGPYTLSVTEIE